MSDEIRNLLDEVDAYLAEANMAPSTFGRKSVNDGKCIDRLRAGGRAWPETIEAMRSFMKSHPPAPKSEAAA